MKFDKEEDILMNDLIKKVEQWSIDKNLHKAEASKQYLKFQEEAGEIASALARGQGDNFKDSVGDTIVTLIILAQIEGTSLEECLSIAYEEIKDRTGKTVNGVFVKSEDLR